MGLFNKIWSGLDFWDKAENKAQRDSFAQQDEEDRKRKAQQASLTSVQRPTMSVGSQSSSSPTPAPQFDMSKPLYKVGASQSDSLFTDALKPQKNSIFGELKPITPEQEAAYQLKEAKRKDLEKFTADNMEQARKDATQGEGFFGRNFLNRKAIEERAKTAAATKAQKQFSDKYGYTEGGDPVLKEFQDANRVRMDAETARLDNDIKTLNKVDKVTKKVGSIAQYVPVTGSVMNLGLAGTEKLAKAVDPNSAMGKDIENTRLQLDVGMTKQEFDKLDPKTQQKLRNLQNLGLALSPLDFIGTGGLAKSGVVSAGKAGAKEFIEKGAVKEVTKQALKDALKAEGKSALKTFAVGTGASIGAQAYLGGKDNINLLDAAKSGAMVTGASTLFSPGSAVDDSAKKLARASEEAPSISVLKKIEQTTEEVQPGIEVAEGFKSSNLKKVSDEKKAVLGATDEARSVGADIPNKAIAAAENISPPRVPDATNPIALAKNTATPEARTPLTLPSPAKNDAPIADFTKAVEAPLQKAQTDIAMQGSDPVVSTQAPSTDALGNQALQTDIQNAQQLNDQGLAIQRGDSVASTTEDAMANAAERAARNEVSLTGAAAPRTRARITARLDDANLAADLNRDVPALDKIPLQEAENNAKAFVNNLSDESLVGRYSGDVRVSDPQGFYEALNSIRRLEQIDHPDAHTAIRNALDGMTNYASESGRGLRTVQVVFEDMPTTMKVDYLMKKLQTGSAEFDDSTRAGLLSKIQASDQAAEAVRALEGEAQQLLDSGLINNRSMAPEVKAKAAELSDAISKADRMKEMAQGDAWKFYQDALSSTPQGKTPLGKRIGDVGRTLMLSSPAGRVFDVISTGATTADDILTKSVSAGLGKVVNKFVGRGSVQDTGFSPGEFIKGGVEGFKDTIDSFKGKARVESILDEANKNTRGNVNTGGGRIRNAIRSLVEVPTNLTRGLQNDELFSSAMQEAAKLGLKGDAQKTWAHLRSAVPSEEQLRGAEQAWKRANMLHDNPVSRALNNVANSLDKKGGGWASPLIRNQIAPFTSWVGGNLHRTLTDKNVLWNVGAMVDSARKGDLQGVVDNIAKFAVNSGEAMAVGYMLTEAGVITTEDANGDSYGGLYFHVGDRYIPVAASGTFSVPIIFGNAVHQSMQSGDLSTGIDALGSNTLKNAGIASTFGGENNFQKSISEATKPNGSFTDAAAQYVGGTARQYIPAITADANAVLDQTSLNPTHEAADTKATYVNPATGKDKTDVMATEVNKTLNRIPFVSQGLDRKEGVPAQDLLDRALKSNRETGKMVEDRQTKESLKDMEKRLVFEKVPIKDDDIQDSIDGGDYENALKGLDYKLAKAQADPTATNRQIQKIKDQILQTTLQSEGVPIDNEGIKARSEAGDYDNAILGYRYQLKKIENDKNVPESKRQDMRDEITRLKVTRDGKYPAAVIKMYSETSVSEWRALGNPESEDYDPELYQMLWAYDEALAKAGVSRSPKTGDKQKYSAGKGRGGGGGSRGSAKSQGFTTSIALQKFNGGGFTPQKALPASFGEKKSAIPVLDKVPNNDQSKRKKISVSKGGLA